MEVWIKVDKMFIKTMLLFGCFLMLFLQYTPDAAAAESGTEAKHSLGKLQLGEKYPAELVKCIDGDTAHFEIDGQVYKTRFLYIDTPESTNEIEPFGKEASVFTCNFLMSGKITIETDGDTLFDEYGRLLAWVWVGDQLQQEEITKAGFVEKFYDYGDYLYEERLIAAMESAKKLSKGIYASKAPFKSRNSNSMPPPNQDTVNEVMSQRIQFSNEEIFMKSEKTDVETESKSSSSNVITGLVILFLLVIFVKNRKKSVK